MIKKSPTSPLCDYAVTRGQESALIRLQSRW